MSNRRKTRMSQAELDRLAADWQRARSLEVLARGQEAPQQAEETEGK